MKHYARSRAWCEWAEFDAWRARALASMSDPEAAALPPFHLLSLPGISPAQQRQCAERWMDARLAASADERAALALEFAPRNALAPDALHKIRVGYLSRDFQDHATAWLLVEALEACDHSRFELHAYSYGADDRSGLRQRLQTPFHRFTDISAYERPGGRPRHPCRPHRHPRGPQGLHLGHPHGIAELPPGPRAGELPGLPRHAGRILLRLPHQR